MASSDYGHHFSERNVPFGIASSEKHEIPQAVTRLGNTVLFLRDLAVEGLFNGVDGLHPTVLVRSTLNDFAALPAPVHGGVRKAIQDAFGGRGLDAFPDGSKEDIAVVNMHLPVSVGDFVDFSCSLEHVKNAGRIITKNDRPPPSYFQFPIGYQGRASSIVASGTEIERPMGQYLSKVAATAGELHGRSVVYGSSAAVDYELELAVVIGRPLSMGQKLTATEADNHIFGFVLLNDWSARDIQGFEMAPLGPLNGKNFGTSISPWIITLEALEPFKVRRDPHPASIPDYLLDPGNSTYSICMQVEILAGDSSTVTGTSWVQTMYWTVRHMIAHIVSAGSGLRTGDVMATGTVSGPEKGAQGCLLESTEGGAMPIELADGSRRTYLHDGDIVRMTAVAGGPTSGVGFGECTGKLLPSRPL